MSWGNRLLITFIVFGIGMAYLVVRSVQVTTELVEVDYYEKELQFQAQLDASNRGTHLGEILVRHEPNSIDISWPTSQEGANLKGEAWFYCAYDKSRDRRLPIQTVTGKLQIDKKQLAPGQYTLKLSWSDGADQYYQEQKIDIAP